MKEGGVSTHGEEEESVPKKELSLKIWGLFDIYQDSVFQLRLTRTYAVTCGFKKTSVLNVIILIYVMNCSVTDPFGPRDVVPIGSFHS